MKKLLVLALLCSSLIKADWTSWERMALLGGCCATMTEACHVCPKRDATKEESPMDYVRNCVRKCPEALAKGATLTACEMLANSVAGCNGAGCSKMDVMKTLCFNTCLHYCASKMSLRTDIPVIRNMVDSNPTAMMYACKPLCMMMINKMMSRMPSMSGSCPSAACATPAVAAPASK